MADRPGALGQVASRIGALKADIISVVVQRQDSGTVIDEFLLRVPEEPRDLPMMICDEIEQVDEVVVISHRVVDDDTVGLITQPLVWFELLVDDCSAASDFYARALGWRTEPASPVGDQAYHLIIPFEGSAPIGALVADRRAERGSPPAGAILYVETPSLGPAVSAFEAAGGAVRVRTDGGGFPSAVVADPWGNRLGLWPAAAESPAARPQPR